MTTVFLVRHGATDWNDALRAQGHADVPLNEKGDRQARTAADRLKSLPINGVYSSDLSRARATAERIAAIHGLPVIEASALREIDQGEWTGLNDKEIKLRWPGAWEARRQIQRPGGESPAQVRRRAIDALAEIVAASPSGTIVIVSHGVTIRGILAEALGLDDADATGLRGLGNGGIVRFEASQRDGRLVFGEVHRLDEKTPAGEDPNA